MQESSDITKFDRSKVVIGDLIRFYEIMVSIDLQYEALDILRDEGDGLDDWAELLVLLDDIREHLPEVRASITE